MSTNPISFSGFNGFDFGSIVNAIIQQDSLPLTNLQNQQQAEQNTDSAMVQLGSDVGSLESDTNSLIDPMAFTNVSATSSDTTTLTATSGSGAIAGQYNITIGNTAKAQTTASTTTNANTTDIVADGGSISFTMGGQTTTPINVTSATSLSQLQGLINAQNSGVVASIVNNGSANVLVISSRATGAANGFTINNSLTNSTGTAIAFAAGQNTTTGNMQNAQDAAITVNGLNITSASNTISTAIPGISFTLIKAGTASLTVANDYSNVANAISSFVADFNKLHSFYSQESVANSNGQAAPLEGDPVLRQVFEQIRSAVQQSSSNGGAYNYLSQIGIEVTDSGDLSFNQSTFNSAMSTNPNDVAKLIQGTNGVFTTLQPTLNSLDATAGLIATTRTSIAASLAQFRQEIQDQQAMLDQERTSLQQEYNAADQAISQLNSERTSLSQFANRTIG